MTATSRLRLGVNGERPKEKPSHGRKVEVSAVFILLKARGRRGNSHHIFPFRHDFADRRLGATMQSGGVFLMLAGHPGRICMALVFAVWAALNWAACGGVGPAGKPPAAESAPRALASMERGDPTLILDADNDRPAPLAGDWRVATGERTCSLSIVVDESDLSGQTSGCSEAAGPRPIAIGLIGGSSFLFQTGRGSEGWIWSGRYNSAKNVLEGRREHVITGKLESFVARR